MAPPRYGSARALREWREFGKAAIAWAIACGLLGAAIFLVDDPARTGALDGWISKLTVVLAIWGAIALSYTVFPKREKVTARG